MKQMRGAIGQAKEQDYLEAVVMLETEGGVMYDLGEYEKAESVMKLVTLIRRVRG